jgi:hypothetical protein
MGVLGPVLASREQSRASDRATQQQTQASAEAIAEQRRQFDLSREDQLPWLQSGRAALGSLDRAAAGDLSGFEASPDYAFRRNEGMRGIGNSFAARGGAASGNALRALAEFNQNLARGEFGDWWNRTAARANVGQTTASGLGALGANTAQTIGNIGMNSAANIGNNIIAGGNARATGIRDASQGASNAFGYFMGWGK